MKGLSKANKRSIERYLKDVSSIIRQVEDGKAVFASKEDELGRYYYDELQDFVLDCLNLYNTNGTRALLQFQMIIDDIIYNLDSAANFEELTELCEESLNSYEGLIFRSDMVGWLAENDDNTFYCEEALGEGLANGFEQAIVVGYNLWCNELLSTILNAVEDKFLNK